jgi:hypothetical protein
VKHAKLSASGSKKWKKCTLSASLEALFPEQDSLFSSEGTFGHSIFQHRLEIYLERDTEYPFEDRIPGHKEYWTQELSDSVQDSVDYAIERIEAARKVCPDAVILLEQRLDFSPWVPEGFGTADLVIITDTYIEVIDLKMGSGVFVSAHKNSQFRLYMLGAYNQYGHLYGATMMRGTVLQPRLNNYGSEELTALQLLDWAEEEIVEQAKLAFAGEGQFVPGDHCTECFCKARYTCKARADHHLVVAKADFALTVPDLMTEEQIVLVLTKADAAITWLKDVQDYAQKQVIENGKTYPGFKLVEGRSNRKYSNPDAAAAALVAAGIPEALIYERSLLGITAMTSALGKKKFAEVLDAHVVKPQGKPTLVPVSDKREEFKPTSVISDFS